MLTSRPSQARPPDKTARCDARHASYTIHGGLTLAAATQVLSLRFELCDGPVQVRPELHGRRLVHVARHAHAIAQVGEAAGERATRVGPAQVGRRGVGHDGGAGAVEQRGRHL